MTHSENRPSLPEVHRSIPVPNSKGFWRKMLATVALSIALFINSAILILSAATFHFSGYRVCESILVRSSSLASGEYYSGIKWLAAIANYFLAIGNFGNTATEDTAMPFPYPKIINLPPK